MSYLQAILEFLTTPSQFFFTLAILAFLALIGNLKRLATVALASSLTGFFMFGFTSLSELPIAPLVTRFPPIDLGTASPPFGIVVLGAGMSEPQALHNGALMEFTDGAETVPTATLLAQRYPEAKIILSGGSGTDFPPSPERGVDGMRRLMLEFGISGDRIVIDPNSSTTAARAHNTLALIGEDRDKTWWVITSAHRMPRLMGVYRNNGFEPVAYPVDFKWMPPFSPTYFYRFLEGLQLTDLGAHEWRGLVFYYLKGEIGTLFPGPAQAG